ncbi:ethanolamine kinase 1 [Venturia canescens]|uniref:ethanolamine kinase 1 n=1 Tax=Venturia canescens TaxID=32260 RepID=UPI001C9C1D70|nr:ethanolamine kinase 1 [Venturia canescens]XP_043269200.1 ethanolamine kinase 1 [Venturia canescens]XP_043269202.1 ethanolamine kinase 1 [Venturia canescens]XP_043269203.1 ethanolamine kinase 1 [Venturia canescens]
MERLTNEVHLDLTVDESELIEGATEVVKSIRPDWPVDQFRFKVFTNGITNKLVGVWYPDHYNEMVLVRVYGHKTDLLINRKDETRNIRILHRAGYTHSLYATFNNGLAYEFIQGDILTVENVRQPDVYWLVAKRMAQMHKLNPNLPDTGKEPIIWEKTEKFMSIMPKEFDDPEKQLRFENLVAPYHVLENEYTFLKAVLPKLNNPVVFAHNDLLLGNILYNKKENTVTFIDFEYTGYNYQAFDIANHFAEFVGIEMPDYALYPDETFQRSWIRIYLQAYRETSNVSEDDVNVLYEHVRKFLLLSHFFWGCWSLIQSKHSSIDFDFLQYASIRFKEYFHRKDSLIEKFENC